MEEEEDEEKQTKNKNKNDCCRLSGKAVITRDLCLGRSEMLRNLRHACKHNANIFYHLRREA